MSTHNVNDVKEAQQQQQTTEPLTAEQLAELAAQPRTFQQLSESLMKGDTLKDFSPAEQKVYLDAIGATNVSNGTIKAPKVGQVEIPFTSVTGKTYNVRLYATENGQMHFQGAPGTNQKFGRSMSVQEMEFYFSIMELVVDWIGANNHLLARKAADGKIYLNGKVVTKE